MPYFNYAGVLAPEVSTPTRTLYGTDAGHETLTAPSGPSAVDPAGGAGDLMLGSSGDNLFYIREPSERVQVADGLPGVKSVVAYTSFALPLNVQNLEVTGSFAYATGNPLNNLIVGRSDHQTLAAGEGDDVMVGGGGGTSFVVTAGRGNDVIYNFTPYDNVRLAGSAFHTFAQVKGAMTQRGADVVVQINPSETLTLRDVNLSQLTEGNFLLPLDRSKLGPATFVDDFNSLDLYNFSTGNGRWLTNFGSDPKKQEAYHLAQNGELQVYASPSFQGLGDHALGYDPFSVAGGALTITARPIPEAERQVAFNSSYSSGVIDTRGIFAQKYGYFEIRMATPSAQGAWPAFWMVPDPNPDHVEADIGEITAIQPNIDHIRAYGGGEVHGFAEALKTGELSGFHNYGMLWTPQGLTFYYDDQAVYQTATPAEWTAPMYMIANLAVGGYGGPPNDAEFPASVQIDYIRAYALPDGSSVVQNGTPLAPGGTLKLAGAATPGAPALAAQAFDDDHAALSTRQVVRLSADAAHAPAGELAAAGPRGFLVWDENGALHGAAKNDSAIGPSAALAQGVSASQVHGTFLADGKIALAWLQNDGGVQHAWVEVVDPATMAVQRQQLGVATGGLVLTPGPHGTFVASWQNGAQFQARGYDGHGYFGEAVVTSAPAAGFDAAGRVVVAWTDGSGQHAQLYGLQIDPFNRYGDIPSAGRQGTAGDDLLAGAGGDRVEGLAGSDTLIGGGGAETLWGGDGADSILGGSGFNAVNGNKGADTLIGQSAVGDWLLGGQDDDRIDATRSTGRNIINGNLGADTLQGGVGGDSLRGGQGDDVVTGGPGRDWIAGDLGRNTLAGGGGADIFFQPGAGAVNVVSDFRAADGDRVQVAAGAQYAPAQAGPDVHVDLAGGGQLILQNVQLAGLPSGWIFAG